MIDAEDVDGNLLPALERIASFMGARVLDLGSGTGRIPLLLRKIGCEVVAVDRYMDMLSEQAALESGAKGLLQADLRALPIGSGTADVVTAGWVIGHFTGWYGENWQAEANRALGEMARGAKTGGKLIILETMGTGVEAPGPPTEGLASYYAWLEGQGFEQQVVSTDYEFASVERAAELCGFFFGEEMEVKVRERGWRRVPEWTGIWWKSTERPLV